jgi:Cu(I)/Ag(I) efflux system membrane fusion protein
MGTAAAIGTRKRATVYGRSTMDTTETRGAQMSKRIRRWWPLALVVVVALAGAGVYLYCGGHMPAVAAKAGNAKARYHCPMHPTYVSDRPGDCPICGMKLVPIEQDKPQRQPAVGNTAKAGPMVAGQAAIYLSPEKQQLIGLRTGVVERVPMTKVIRTVGQITADETRISRVYTKVGGWVDKLYVNFTGDLVRKGQPLLSIYSPELVATQEEYLLALRAQNRLRASPFEEVADGGSTLLAATRRRLELWDVPEAEIRRIEQAGRPIKTITLYAPTSGYVMEKSVLEGQKVDSSTPLMVVADLSVVWVQAEFYEEEAGVVQVGDAATLTVNSYPGHEWRGRIDYIYPSVDPTTRTLRARLRFANHGVMLKPGMYGNVLIQKPLGSKLTVPEEAILDSGTRQIVFLDRGDGHFEPREVEIGQRTDGRREILSGLEPGDRIVTSGNFLIDSESRLKSALQDMQAMPGMDHGTASGDGDKQKPAADRSTQAPMEKPQGPAPAGHAGHTM